MFRHWCHPRVELVGGGNAFEGVSLGSSALEHGEVLLESGTDLEAKLDFLFIYSFGKIDHFRATD